MIRGVWCMVGIALAAGALVGLPAHGRAQSKEGLHFEIYQDAQKEYRWRLKDADGKVLATAGQGYKAKDSATKGVQRLQTEANGKLTFEVYEDNAKAYRWRAKAANGQVVASSATGYKEKAECEKTLDVIKKGVAKAPVKEE
jgi:uncharacterized protein YegP (UPF0339 family)